MTFWDFCILVGVLLAGNAIITGIAIAFAVWMIDGYNYNLIIETRQLIVNKPTLTQIATRFETALKNYAYLKEKKKSAKRLVQQIMDDGENACKSYHFDGGLYIFLLKNHMYDEFRSIMSNKAYNKRYTDPYYHSCANNVFDMIVRHTSESNEFYYEMFMFLIENGFHTFGKKTVLETLEAYKHLFTEHQQDMIRDKIISTKV